MIVHLHIKLLEQNENIRSTILLIEKRHHFKLCYV